jgi:hypothetical protein
MRTSCVAAAILLMLTASPLQAQSIVDGHRVEFQPSADNNTLGSDGTPIVQSYALSVYVSGASTAFATANLGKPTPDTDGYMRIDFSTLLSTPLQVGTIYEAVVSAVGPGGTAASTRSNTFELTTNCTTTLSTSAQNVGAGSTTGSVGVTATCGWVALSNASWITITGGASGTGNGTVGFSVAANTATTSRTGTLTIAGNTFTVTQSGAQACTYSLSATSQTGAPGGGTGSVTVTAPSGCAWTAASNNGSWLTVTAGASGSGNGTVGFSTTPNLTGASRTGTLLIGGVTFTLTQSACTYTVAPTSVTIAQGTGTGSVTLTTSAGCTWTASSSASWVTVTASGTGPGSVLFAAVANSSGPSRTATLTIAGQKVSVTQAGLVPQAPTNVHIIR